VRLANRGGGEDNITLVFFEIAESLEQTAEIPVPGAAPPVERDEPEEEDEDTLDELDAIPTLGTPAVDTPPERGLRSRLAAFAIVTAVLVFVALAALALWAYLS
jgi:hypothetical protein